MSHPLQDRHGRVHRSLRISVTDRCNFRCPYCMPLTPVVFQPRAEMLSYEEFEQLVGIGVRLGIREVRITGGEPLLRRDLDRLVAKLAAIEELEEVSLTTNGFHLKEWARPLRQAGLDRINISLDTLRRDRFRDLARVDGMDRWLQGLEAVRSAGFSPIKVNVVLMRGINDDEVLDFVEWARRDSVSVRFIELMPIGGGSVRGPEHLVSGAETRRRIEERYPLVAHHDGDLTSPARIYRFTDGPGEVGFINPVTEPFCGRCDRLRITADGKLSNCLFDQGALDLKEPLRKGKSREEIETIWRSAVNNKGPGGCLDLEAFLRCEPERKMWQIGG